MQKTKQIIFLAICFAIVTIIAAQRDSHIWGHNLAELTTEKPVSKTIDTLRTEADGTMVVNTTSLGKNIEGYGGIVPLEIYIKNNKVIKVTALPNSETPDFFNEAKTLLTQWNGKTINVAQNMNVDAVSGATYSSKAIIRNVKRGLEFAAQRTQTPSAQEKADLSTKDTIGLIIVLMAAVIPLFYKNKYYRLLQQVLNVAVLGFWGGIFLSWGVFVKYMSNGIDLWASLIPLIMLATAFIYPLFGKKQYYCTHVCPCGSMQDLLGKTNKRKWKMSSTISKRLNFFRQILFYVLILLAAIGVCTEWMDYEVFSAFIFYSASVAVLLIGAVTLILSLFIPRPYCRFVCPTGSLFKLAEGKWK